MKHSRIAFRSQARAIRWMGVAAALSVGVAAATYATAAGPQAAQIAAQRKANYKEIGGAFKSINDEVKSGAPDMNTVRSLTRDLAARANATLKQFPRGSGPGAGVTTRARPEIWSDYATFTKLQNDFVRAATALNGAAQGGNAALTSATRTLGVTCKSCHDRFRAEP